MTTVGTNAPPENGAVTLFPNPTSGYVSWIGDGGAPVLLRVFNAFGQLLVERIVENSQANLSSLNSGLYYVQLLSQQDNSC
ncbi:MAG: T9SS type A sorting domain-containing protein [Lewinellaceae bacterium]|nr:T9SS type A sorting domain-containing protein [Lewinellaceae bacterium]